MSTFEQIMLMQLFESVPDDILIARRTRHRAYLFGQRVYWRISIAGAPNRRSRRVQATRLIGTQVINQNFVHNFLNYQIACARAWESIGQGKAPFYCL